MFNNPGKFIKMISSVIFGIGVVFALVSSIGIGSFIRGIIGDKAIVTVIVLLIFGIGFLVSWICSIFMYGFGELVENSSKIANAVSGYHKVGNSDKIQGTVNNAESYIDTSGCDKDEDGSSEKVITPLSENDEDYVDITCSDCQEKLSYPKSYVETVDDLKCPICGKRISI